MLHRKTAAASIAAVALGLLFAPVVAAAPSAAGATSSVNQRACGVPAAERAACFAVRHFKAKTGAGPHRGGHKTSSPPLSYGATQLQAAYGLTAAAVSGGKGETVAIVDAYDDPNAYADLAVYRHEEGLPAVAPCSPAELSTSSSSPCFAKANQSGAAGPYPSSNAGWAEEISLDLDMVSAICPECNVLLVEADSNELADLGTAVDTAAGFGPVAIGNSYGAAEFSRESEFLGYYTHPGIAVTAATGDNGYGVEFPAAATSAIAVGGTSLRQQSDGSWTQSVWSGTGSGCSAYVPKPTWQTDQGCATRRTVGDVAADADPNTGVRVYDTFGVSNPGWMIFGGTSASTQIIAAVYGLAEHGASNASGLYGGGTIKFGSPNPGLTDVTSGSNGSCAGRGRFVNQSLAYLCTGETGYDGPTGMGTPRGLAAF